MGRKQRSDRVKDAKREPNGQLSRRREEMLSRGALVYEDGIVYFVRGDDGVKIGYTGKLQDRTSQLRREHESNILVLAAVALPTRTAAIALERRYHFLFSAKCITGEWFDLGDADIRTAVDLAKSLRLKTFGCEEAAPVPLLRTSFGGDDHYKMAGFYWEGDFEAKEKAA